MTQYSRRLPWVLREIERQEALQAACSHRWTGWQHHVFSNTWWRSCERCGRGEVVEVDPTREEQEG